MSLLFRTSESPWSIRVLHDSDSNRILAFLNQQPILNIFLISRIHDEGLSGSPTVEVRLGSETICVASLSGNIVLAARYPRHDAIDAAVALIAERILSRGIPVRAIISEADLVEHLWDHLRTRLDPPTVARLRQPVYVLEQSRHPLSDLQRVRYSLPSDLDALVPACAAMHREEVGIDPLERDAWSYRERVRELIASRRSMLLVEQGRLIFKCEFSAVSPEAVQLMGVWTDPALRRRGHARLAMREVCGHILRSGRKVTLFVNDFNIPAIRLYEEIGFRRIGDNRALIW